MKFQKKIDTFNAIYVCSILLRILLVLVPQTGYIHPDEFFQSVEVLAGKFLDIECSPPWEFNVTFPLRSMTIPYFTIGQSYKSLRYLNSLSELYFQKTILGPYLLLVVPRLLMCLLSFLVDYCLYKICSNNNEKCKSRLVILASSYVTIVYGTRTFSNTVELVLFSTLIYLVCESLTFSNIVLRNREYINFRYDNSKSTAEKAKFHKLRLFIVSDSYRNCFAISTISVMGFFNRPTFLAFAVIPVFFWLYRGLGSKSVTPFQFYRRICVFLLCSIPALLLNILVDSFYYGYITSGEIFMLEVTINSFVFTPLNFLKYNLNADNLAIHGIHPRFLHALVNIPLLFNVLGLCTVYTLGKYLYLCFQKKFNLLPTIRSIKCLMTLSAVVPVAILSIFPHQEPRFLLPVILPLVYLHATTILREPEDTLVEAPKTQIKPDSWKTKPSNSLLTIWLLVNVLLGVLYGFLHQGGVLPATAYLARDMELTSMKTEYHIVTSHIYSIPESFFLQKSSYKLYSRGKTRYSVNKRVFLYEEGSKNLEFILRKLKLILDTRSNPGKRMKLFLLISGSLGEDLMYFSSNRTLKLDLVEQFRPHLSLEAFPDLTTHCLEPLQGFYSSNCLVLTPEKYFKWLFDSFSLNLYQVEEDEIKVLR
nr:GPI mannosyltransferase 4 [Leptinotarsa decemlineata]